MPSLQAPTVSARHDQNSRPQSRFPSCFFSSPPKRLPVPNCLLSFISRGMLGKRVAGFQTLPSHKLTTIALAESANLLSASAFISPESPSLDTLTRTELTKNSSEGGRSANDCPRDHQRKARAHLRDPTCMPAPPHRDWYGQRRTESAHGSALIWSPIGSRARSRTMMGQNTVPRVPLPFPNTPAPTPDLFAEG